MREQLGVPPLNGVDVTTKTYVDARKGEPGDKGDPGPGSPFLIITQEDYDALAVKDPKTLYVITAAGAVPVVVPMAVPLLGSGALSAVTTPLGGVSSVPGVLSGGGLLSATAGVLARITPTVVGYAVAAATAGNTITFTKSDLPALADGDYLVAFLRCSTSAATTLYAATGFTLVAPASYTVDANGRLIGAHAHVVATAASEPSTYAFSFTGTAGRQAGVLLLLRGVDTTNPVSGVANGAANYYSHGAFGFGWPTTIGSLMLAAAANEVVSPNASEPTQDSDFTLVANEPSTTGTAVTRTVVNVGKAIATTTIAPSNAGTVWISTSSLAYWSLSLQGVQQVTFPTVTPGFPNVRSMLAWPGATMGHRGASGVPGMPEMSERSYDYCVQRGYGILEFSANRTSDGVWIGCHDADLNRTSQTTGLPAISAMTYAQLMTYQNSLNSGGSPAPYYKLVDFLDKYTPTHVVMCDPKQSNSGPQITDFLNTLDAHGGPSKIVVKSFGVGAGSLYVGDQATLRGYQTWGYFYDAAYADGDLAADQSHWSILGMEIGASAPAWTAVKSYGKKVIGHIAASQTDYNTAIANGADIVQCSRPDLITPVSSRGKQAITVVQSAQLGSLPISFPNPVTVGNTVVVVANGIQSAVPVVASPTLGGSSVSGAHPIWNDGGNSNSIIESGGSPCFTTAWVLPNCPAANGVNFGTNNISATVGLAIYEVAGLGPAPVVNVSAEAFDSTGTSDISSGATGNTTATPACVIGGCAAYNGPIAGAPGVTCLTSSGNGWAGYQIATTAGSSYTWAQDNGHAGGGWTAGVAAIVAGS